ncbi:hypothetical protein OKF32_07915 [Lentilactobacillus buchneri]|nr:hypothetical protein OKF32_07915 [Lentilactobacillus sp. Egmn17]
MTLHTILTPEWIHEAKLIAAENPRLEGFVPSEGGLHPRILLLGEAPGDKEVKIGRPFMGPSGKELDRWLASLGLTREDIYITGVVKSRPFSIGKTGRKSDRRPNQKEVKRSAAMFDWELSHFQVPRPKSVIYMASCWNAQFKNITSRRIPLNSLRKNIKSFLCIIHRIRSGSRI